MNSTTSDSKIIRTPFRKESILAVFASLLLAPCLFAQTAATPATGAAAQPAAESGSGPRGRSPGDDLPPNHPAREKLHNFKYDGGRVSKLGDALRAEFPADNVVLSDTVDRLALPAFELRNVSLAEIGRTIEFLGEGQMEVEVAIDAGTGNIWRIGRRNIAANAATVKMRSVAGPNLFADEKALNAIQTAAEEMEMKRLNVTSIMSGARGVFRGATATPLKDQNLFVIIGDEEGVAGLENLIDAAEQQLAQAAAARDASLAANAPKTRTVLAPHVFSREDRLKNLMENADHMQMMWSDLNAELSHATGSQGKRFFGARIEPRSGQKVFVLLGSEDAIAGMESLIQAAEKLAMEEDEKISAEMQAERAKQAEERAKEEGSLKAAEERARKDKGEQ